MGAETLSASDGTLVPSARTIDAPTSPPMAIDGTPSVDRASWLKICEREVIARGGAALFGEGTPEQSRATSALQYLIASACWMGALDPAHAKAASESVPTIAR